MAQKEAEYRLAPKARDDMEAVWLYSLTAWGRQQAEQYVDDLTAAFGCLADSPKAGRGCDHIRQGYRRYTVKRHMVYYREAAYGIEIMRILHDGRVSKRRASTTLSPSLGSPRDYWKGMT